MPGGDIYQAWANASPTIPFPFTYQDKKVGKIQMSWSDVRNGIQKDSVSTALPFCTSHITPSIVQVNIIADAIRKENQYQQRWKAESVARARSQNSMSVDDEGSTARATSSMVRMALRSAQEQDALVNSEGGRGRKAYLKLRQHLHPQVRYEGRARTSSQTYGWNIETPECSSTGAGNTISSLSNANDAQHQSQLGRSITSGGGGATSQFSQSSPYPTTTESVPSPTSMLRFRFMCTPRNGKTAAAATRTPIPAENTLTEALDRERNYGLNNDAVGTGLNVRPSHNRKQDRTDFRRKNTLSHSHQASGVFPSHNA